MEQTQMESVLDEIVKTGKLSGQKPPDTWLAILSRLESIDLDAEEKMKKYAHIALGSAFLFVVSIFSGIALSSSVSWGYYSFFLIPVAVAGIAFGVFFHLKYSRWEIDNGFRNYLIPLLKALDKDIKKDCFVPIEMTLLPTNHKDFLKSKSEKYKKGAYYACYDRLYEREYMTLKARLYDGNRLTLSVLDSLTETEMTKQNPRGKIKTKYKYKKQRMTYMIRLQVNPAKYRCETLSEQNEKIGVKKADVRQTEKGPILTMVYTDKKKKIKTDPDEQITLQLIGRLYANLTLVTSA